MSGSATLTTVMSSSSMKIATETAISVHHLRSTTAPLVVAARVTAPHYMNDHAAPDDRCRRSRAGTPGVGSARLQVPCRNGTISLPQLRGRLGAVGRAVVGEEGVAGALVDVDFDLLAARAAARSRSCSASCGRGVLVLGADRREQRAAAACSASSSGGVGRCRRRALVGRGAVDEAAPAVDGGVEAVAAQANSSV